MITFIVLDEQLIDLIKDDQTSDGVHLTCQHFLVHAIVCGNM